jgi:hypothetical protein
MFDYGRGSEGPATPPSLRSSSSHTASPHKPASPSPSGGRFIAPHRLRNTAQTLSLEIGNWPVLWLLGRTRGRPRGRGGRGSSTRGAAPAKAAPEMAERARARGGRARGERARGGRSIRAQRVKRQEVLRVHSSPPPPSPTDLAVQVNFTYRFFSLGKCAAITCNINLVIVAAYCSFISWTPLHLGISYSTSHCLSPYLSIVCTSVADPDPPNSHVFGPPGSGSTNQMYGSGSFYFHAKIVRKTLIPIILWLFLTFYLWKWRK